MVWNIDERREGTQLKKMKQKQGSEKLTTNLQ